MVDACLELHRRHTISYMGAMLLLTAAIYALYEWSSTYRSLQNDLEHDLVLLKLKYKKEALVNAMENQDQLTRNDPMVNLDDPLYQVPEQASLPKRADQDQEVSDMPEEERWSLVKGLKRLVERMPLRYPAR